MHNETAPALSGPGAVTTTADAPPCRVCGAALGHVLVDLGMSPLCQSLLSADRLNAMEPFYPLRVLVCDRCFLAQLEEYVSPVDIFSDYAYFSSYADSWLDHARRYTDRMTERWKLSGSSQVVELASNDGYLLQYFVAGGIPALGVEPAANVAKVAVERGVPTLVRFFGSQTAREMVQSGTRADLLLGNNVLAQVPDLNDFIEGMRILLKPDGVITIEFPHLVRLIEENQFDTIYHEHFSYFSLFAVERAFERHSLLLFDVEELPTHGGSLRIFARHAADASKPVTRALEALRQREHEIGVQDLRYYAAFEEKVKATKRKLLTFLNEVKDAGKTIAGYGAPGKGNTLLNYCGIRIDYLDYTVDRSPYRQGKFTPGTHIPIYPPDRIRVTRPDYVFILPWNLKDEIMDQMKDIRSWGGRFIVPIPTVTVFD